MSLFRILLAIDVIAALVIFYFFVEGLGDGSVSSYNGGLWFMILAGVAAILGGGCAFQAQGRPGLAKLVLTLGAVPAILFFGFFLIIIVSQPNWH